MKLLWRLALENYHCDVNDSILANRLGIERCTNQVSYPHKFYFVTFTAKILLHACWLMLGSVWLLIADKPFILFVWENFFAKLFRCFSCLLRRNCPLTSLSYLCWVSFYFLSKKCLSAQRVKNFRLKFGIKRHLTNEYNFKCLCTSNLNGCEHLYLEKLYVTSESWKRICVFPKKVWLAACEISFVGFFDFTLIYRVVFFHRTL